MKPIVTALCSFGMSGQVFHGPLLKVLPQFKIHKILERNHRISEKRYPQATIVQDFDKILNDPVIELVIVNTPDYLHFEMAKMAMTAGKHVVIEKPFVKKIKKAWFFDDQSAVKFKQTEFGNLFSIPGTKKVEIDTVVVIEI